jgi:hypothetical protein
MELTISDLCLISTSFNGCDESEILCSSGRKSLLLALNFDVFCDIIKMNQDSMYDELGFSSVRLRIKWRE